MLLVVRHQLGQGPFGVNPASGVHQHHELRRPVAEHHQIRWHAPRDQATQQRPFRGNTHVPFIGDGQLGESSFPGRHTGKGRRPIGQPLQQRRRQFLALPVCQGRFIDRKITAIAL